MGNTINLENQREDSEESETESDCADEHLNNINEPMPVPSSIWSFDKILPQLCQEDFDNMEALSKTLMNDLVVTHEKSDKSMILINLLSRKLQMPLQEWLCSVYHRKLINKLTCSDTNTTEYNIDNFRNEFLLFTQYKKHQHIYEPISRIIDICHERLISAVPSFKILPSYHINDDLNEIILIVHVFSRKLNSRLYNHNFSRCGEVPVHIDLWIIPADVVGNDDLVHVGSDDDDDDENDNDDNFEADDKKIGNIYSALEQCAQLNLENDVYRKTIHNADTNANWFVIMNDIMTNVKMEQYNRYIFIIDRRNVKTQGEIELFWFKAPLNGLIDRKTHSYLSLQYFYNSGQYLCPKMVGSKYNIGMFDPYNEIFGVSYHLKSQNNNSVYWTHYGMQLRFYPSDMKDIWPRVFVKQKNPIYSHLCNNQTATLFVDTQFALFYKETTKTLFMSPKLPLLMNGYVRVQHTKLSKQAFPLELVELCMIYFLRLYPETQD